VKLHGNAALTIRQRSEVRRRHLEEGTSIRTLARQFKTTPNTIHVWVHREQPLDKAAIPHNPHRIVTSEYRNAVIACRQDNPHYGPIRIANKLKSDFPEANRGTVYNILRERDMLRPRKPKRDSKPIPVGRHRVQLDIQQLPAVKGGKKFEYKISMIHMRTRMKYSEIHNNARSSTVADVLEKGMKRLPLFFPGSNGQCDGIHNGKNSTS